MAFPLWLRALYSIRTDQKGAVITFRERWLTKRFFRFINFLRRVAA